MSSVNKVKTFSTNRIKLLNLGSSWDIEIYFKFMQIIRYYEMNYQALSSMIDLGCASGDFIQFYQQHLRSQNIKSPDYIGVDANEQYIDKANIWLHQHETREFFSHTRFWKADLCDEKFWGLDALKKQFDFVLALEIIEHLENPNLFVSRCANIMHKDSSLVISTPVHYNREEGIFRKNKTIHDFEYFYSDFISLIESQFEVVVQFGSMMETNEFKRKLKNHSDLLKIYNDLANIYVPHQVRIPLIKLLVSQRENKMENLTLICKKRR